MPEVQPKALAFKDAINFWNSKIKLAPGEYSKLSNETRMKAFAVSGIAKGDELETVFNALSQAVEGEIGFDQFKEQCREIFERRGWTGVRAWRVDNIFRTNVQSAYMAGRWKQVRAAAKTRPYGQYSAVNDRRTRPVHLAMHGVAYPLDHPFWDTWWPPNGFRCRCTVKTLSARQAKNQGVEILEKDITGTLAEPVDPQTGVRMPARLLMPDPGWQFHPGKSAFGGLVDASRLDNPAPLPNMRGPEDYRRRKLENVLASTIPDLNEASLLPSGKEDAFYISEFTRRYGSEKVVADAMGEPVILSLRSFMADKTPGKETFKFSKPGHGETIGLLEDMVTSPYEIWLTPQRDKSGRIRLTKRYICLWKSRDKQRVGGFTVFEAYRGVLQGVTTFMPMKKGTPDFKYLERQRTGVLIYPRKGRGK